MYLLILPIYKQKHKDTAYLEEDSDHSETVGLGGSIPKAGVLGVPVNQVELARRHPFRVMGHMSMNDQGQKDQVWSAYRSNDKHLEAKIMDNG